MVHAYILIQTEVGKAAAVAKEVSEIAGVAEAEDVTGPYDVIVRAEAKSVDELGKLVVARIQSVEGITRTLTCPWSTCRTVRQPPERGAPFTSPELAHARALRRLGPVAFDGQVEQSLDQVGVAQPDASQSFGYIEMW